MLVVNTGAVDSNGVPLGGSVRVLDARSGVVLRTVAVGVAPIAVAVDERRPHACLSKAQARAPEFRPLSYGRIR